MTEQQHDVAHDVFHDISTLDTKCFPGHFLEESSKDTSGCTILQTVAATGSHMSGSHMSHLPTVGLQ